MKREELTDLLPPYSIGVELGVAKGVFSHALLSGTDKLKTLYSIDAWADPARGHHDDEYQEATKLLAQHGHRSFVIRSTFQDALSGFPDHYFDFIYIDGYAHTGQDNGKTLYQWWKKLKPGGLFSGHDYSPQYPLTVKAVNDFMARSGRQLRLTDDVLPSWHCRK